MAAVLDLALGISQDQEDENSEVRKLQEQQKALHIQLSGSDTDHEQQQQERDDGREIVSTSQPSGEAPMKRTAHSGKDRGQQYGGDEPADHRQEQ